MRAHRLAPLLLVPALLAGALALPLLVQAQGRGAGDLPAPTGRYLAEAVPQRADLVIHTPDLPALLATAATDGLGPAKAWRAAFRKQMEAWGARTGAPELLADGAARMLDAADGELLLASVPMPRLEGPSRATLLAFRTSRREAALREAFSDLFEGGLIVLYPGVPSAEQVGGRDVTALSDAHDRLYVRLQDGLVVVGDHPLALGLLFRGLERGAEPPPAGDMLLEVRHGRGEAAWTGWTYGARESVSWTSGDAGALRVPLLPALQPIVAVALPRAGDAPLLPVPAPGWVDALGASAGGPHIVGITRAGGFAVGGAPADGAAPPEPPEGAGGVRLTGPGAWAICDTAPGDGIPEGATEAVAGGASRLGWLRGWASGHLPLPLPGIDRELLLGPLTAAATSSEGLEPFVTWKAPDRPGELRGPRWHGPTTMLALRTLADIAAKRAPGHGRAAPRAAPPVRTGGAALPPPVEPRTGGDDAK